MVKVEIRVIRDTRRGWATNLIPLLHDNPVQLFECHFFLVSEPLVGLCVRPSLLSLGEPCTERDVGVILSISLS